VIVSTRYRRQQEQVFRARPEAYPDLPLAVLVNGYSASASEIVAACLQDHRRAIIVGQRTFGKGSVQELFELEGSRSALKLTIGTYHRPSGKNIGRKLPAELPPPKGCDVRVSRADRAREIPGRKNVS